MYKQKVYKKCHEKGLRPNTEPPVYEMKGSRIVNNNETTSDVLKKVSVLPNPTTIQSQQNTQRLY